jgi:hypothetical protein
VCVTGRCFDLTESILLRLGHSPDPHKFEIVQVDFFSGEVNVNVHVDVHREEVGTDTSRRTKTHKVSFIVIVEQLELEEATIYKQVK